MNMRKWEKRTSPFPNESNPITSPIKQKQAFYMNKQELKKSPQIKQGTMKSKDLFPFEDNRFKLKSGGGNNNTDELLLELSQARSDLIKANQKLQ